MLNKNICLGFIVLTGSIASSCSFPEERPKDETTAPVVRNSSENLKAGETDPAKPHDTQDDGAISGKGESPHQSKQDNPSQSQCDDPSQSKNEQPKPTPSPTPTPVPTPSPTPSPEPSIDCGSDYRVAASANPFLAAAPAGTELVYPSSKDLAPKNSPVQVVPVNQQCLTVGRQLILNVRGTIAFGSLPDQLSDADGVITSPKSHMLGSVNRLSNLIAPVNSLVGVFLDDSTFDQRPSAPATLDFSTEAFRNSLVFQPQLGQIFFIGNGQTASGLSQSFVVPNGSTRLYLGIMDEYDWSNNLGELAVDIQSVRR